MEYSGETATMFHAWELVYPCHFPCNKAVSFCLTHIISNISNSRDQVLSVVKSSERTRSQDSCSRTWRTSWGADPGDSMPRWRRQPDAPDLERREQSSDPREEKIRQQLQRSYPITGSTLWEGGDNSQGLLYSSFISEVSPRETF